MQVVASEFLDIVDQHDQLLGLTKPRSHVHAELSDWHRVTGIFILNTKNELLCQQRSIKKDVNPGMWQCWFGGHVKAGETYLQNALSEIHEEIGLSLTENQLDFLGYSKNFEHKHHVAVFLYRWTDQTPELKFNDGEVEQVRWLSWNDYLALQKQLLPHKQIKMNEHLQAYFEQQAQAL